MDPVEEQTYPPRTDTCELCGERRDGMHTRWVRTRDGRLVHSIVCGDCSASAPPKIVCLVGSTRFFDAFERANLEETLAGNIVLTVGSHRRSDAELREAGDLKPEHKKMQ